MATASNPPQNLPIVQRIPTRLVPSGTLTINAGAKVQFPGSNARQDRVQVVITNLDGSQLVKIQTLAGVNWATVFGQTFMTFETSVDFQIYNPGANSVD